MLKKEFALQSGDRIEVAIERLRNFEPPDGYYVAFSGGKDSVALLDLARLSGVKHDVHYNLTTVDPPELVRFIRKEYPEVVIHRPALSMWALIVKKRMLPTRKVRYCCEWLKEGRGTENVDRERLVVTGIRWAESSRRAKRKMVEQCRTIPGKKFLHPIIDWEDADVWSYIRFRGIKVCSLYAEGWKRLGCVMCPMAGRDGMLRDADRWPKIAEAYKKAAVRCYQKRIEDGIPTEGWSSGEEMYRWWIENRSRDDENEDQLVLFP